MVRNGKKSPALLFLLGVTLLLSCSSMPANPTSSLIDKLESQPSTVTATAELISPTLTRLVETNTNFPTETAIDTSLIPPRQTSPVDSVADIFAEVRSVNINVSENAYQFTVEIRSPDTGCEQYADWWEVLSQDGDLLYRRILLHSHVNEQPFKRSGGPVAITADTVVIVRAHMHPHGYGDTALQGSVEMGFEPVHLDANFAPDLEEIEPLPTGCAF